MEQKNRTCPQCKNSLDKSAFGWYGDVCNGCGNFREKKAGREEWGIELDRKFDDGGGTGELHLVKFSELKSFIRQLLIKEKAEVDVKGPPLKMKEACEKFKKGKKTFSKSGHLWSKKKIGINEILEGLSKTSKEMGVNIN